MEIKIQIDGKSIKEFCCSMTFGVCLALIVMCFFGIVTIVSATEELEKEREKLYHLVEKINHKITETCGNVN